MGAVNASLVGVVNASLVGVVNASLVGVVNASLVGVVAQEGIESPSAISGVSVNPCLRTAVFFYIRICTHTHTHTHTHTYTHTHAHSHTHTYTITLTRQHNFVHFGEKSLNYVVFRMALSMRPWFGREEVWGRRDWCVIR